MDEARRSGPRGKEAFPVDDPWRWLKQLRQERGAGGIIPAIGSGFNAQAVGTAFGWRDLLVEICKRVGLGLDLPAPEQTIGNTTLIWERMLFDLSRTTRRQPHEVEDELRRVAAQTLREAYPPGGVTSAFARRFLGLGFRDVLSFNFDQGLLEEESTWIPKANPLDPVSAHCRVGSPVRVWYPHGNVKDPSSIQLGIRAYGILIRNLETARQEHKATEEELFGVFTPRPPAIVSHASPGGMDRRPRTPLRPELSMEELWNIWTRHRGLVQSWVSTAMNTPLVFAGLSLGREEWPLWWFLNQRARNHARRNLSWELPTFAILIRREAEFLATAASLVNITLLPVDSYQEGWDRLFDALA